jgi:hypothetical protein
MSGAYAGEYERDILEDPPDEYERGIRRTPVPEYERGIRGDTARCEKDAAALMAAAVRGKRVSPIALQAPRDIIDRTEGKAIQRIVAEHGVVAAAGR